MYILSARDSGKDNGCIIDAAVQAARDPDRIAICVQKENLTREMIEKSGQFNLSVLTEDAPFEIFRHFGLQSGRDIDKFADLPGTRRSTNGLLYVTQNTNALISCKVISATDLGSHTMFIGEVTESIVLSQKPSCTYAHYRSAVKPQ